MKDHEAINLELNGPSRSADPILGASRIPEREAGDEPDDQPFDTAAKKESIVPNKKTSRTRSGFVCPTSNRRRLRGYGRTGLRAGQDHRHFRRPRPGQKFAESRPCGAT